jgi:threonine dehydrogenase-like Zn-dependent dehydrogenase
MNRALVVRPGQPGSAQLADLGDPTPGPDDLVVEPLAIGICGTDREILAGGYGTAPAGSDRLVLGHEAVARVVHTPDEGRFPTGGLVVPIVRRPDPVPCPSCAVGEWDMCSNGRYSEHGIKEADGFARQRLALDADFAVGGVDALGAVAVLVEPCSVVAKAWEQIERIGHRTSWHPTTVLVTGAGPIGLLGALLARQRGLQTHVLDRVTDGPKPGLVRDLGATYHTGPLADVGFQPDIVLECTGVGSVVLDAMEATGHNGIVCLTGLSTGARTVDLDPSALNRRLVLENDVVFGTVNANKRHYEAAIDALTRADVGWLRRLITRRVPLERWGDATDKQADDIKVVVTLSD